jgi:hypothetical protein
MNPLSVRGSVRYAEAPVGPPTTSQRYQRAFSFHACSDGRNHAQLSRERMVSDSSAPRKVR